MPYGALKLDSGKHAVRPIAVAETPMPYGALKRQFLKPGQVGVTAVAETPMPYGALKPFSAGCRCYTIS